MKKLSTPLKRIVGPPSPKGLQAPREFRPETSKPTEHPGLPSSRPAKPPGSKGLQAYFTRVSRAKASGARASGARASVVGQR